MSLRRTLLSLVALSVVVGLLPASSASAAGNRAPKIKKAVMKDANGNDLADRVVLIYNEKIKHKLDKSRFPFRVEGYQISKIKGAKGSRRLVILLKENAGAPLRPASITYKRTRKQPVLDMKNKQARKQLLTKNIIGLTVTSPPPPPPPSEERHTLTVLPDGDGQGVVTSQPTGINCGSTCTADYDEGTSVTLTATPDTSSDSNFGGWQGCASTTTTCTVAMDADKTVTATFTKAGEFALQVLKNGTGTGTVTSTSTPTQTNQINCGATCTVNFAENSVVTLKAVPDAASKAVVAGWSGGGCSGTQDTCNVLMNQAQQVTVTFNMPEVHRLTVTKSGDGQGVVTSTSSPTQATQVNCGSLCQVDYTEGTSVTLTAAAETGSVFAGWSGDATCGTTASCTIPMDAAKNVIATFNLQSTEPTDPAKHQLTVTLAGDGTVACLADGAPVAACDGSYDEGTVVTITATALAPNTHAELSGDCTAATAPLLATCTVTMDAAKNVTATFSAPLLGLGMSQP